MTTMPPPPTPTAFVKETRTRPRLWHVLVGLLAAAPWIAILIAQVQAMFFLCDDSFISFRYARNLVAGHGLVFNQGEYVEGYTNLLWVLEVAFVWLLGGRPEISAHVLSLTWTVVTLALVAANGWRTRLVTKRACVTWIALGFVACCASFASWSTSGLETRQFTGLVVLATYLLSSSQPSNRRLVAASCAFAAAELTRPEGLMLFGCAWLWFLWQSVSQKRLTWPRFFAFSGPFAAILTMHYLWRRLYYGDWLPNTYYAKHVRPWYEAGFDYLLSAGIDLGGYIVLPLALFAISQLPRNRSDVRRFLPFFLIVPHALYLLRIGGDHFEYRPLDFYLPLLAVPAAEGLVLLAARIVGSLRRSARLTRGWHGALAVALFVPALIYAHGVGVAFHWLSLDVNTRKLSARMHVAIDSSNAPWLLDLPGMPAITTISNNLRYRITRQMIAAPPQEHRIFAAGLRAGYSAYEDLPDRFFPHDAVAELRIVGVMPFYLRDLTVIDNAGLTDATIARTPVHAQNSARLMAHDRHPPPGYLQARGVNTYVWPSAESLEAALAQADFAYPVGPNDWMPVSFADREWVPKRWTHDELSTRAKVDSQRATANVVVIHGVTYVGTRLLANFEQEGSALTWRFEGSAHVDSMDAPNHNQAIVFGRIGRHMLTTWDRVHADHGTGKAVSSAFVPELGDHLLLFVGGGNSSDAAVKVLKGSRELRRFTGSNAEHLAAQVWSLDAHAGDDLHVEVHDKSVGSWGHIMVDQIFIGRKIDG